MISEYDWNRCGKLWAISPFATMISKVICQKAFNLTFPGYRQHMTSAQTSFENIVAKGAIAFPIPHNVFQTLMLHARNRKKTSASGKGIIIIHRTASYQTERESLFIVKSGWISVLFISKAATLQYTFPTKQQICRSL